ncbi:MAG: P-loop NTPase [Bacteroidales bacterium]|nr:P-loop NTPase [Bacteroidales bacterium]
MKELTILSGKGGTGKTSITAALASVAKNVVLCDNDVDAADLHLILKPSIVEEHVFHGGWKAVIDADSCSGCGICQDHCRFGAIHSFKNGTFGIDPLACEGCRLCERVCPNEAIHSERSSNNFWYLSNSRFGYFVHAKMGPGEENSGKLVTRVRKKAQEIAGQTGADWIINDGPPGIGCEAIASLSGTSHVLMVIEPTRSGLHDAERLAELIESFEIPASAVINKFDIHTEVSLQIEKFLNSHGIALLARIPFDREVVEAMVNGQSIVEYRPESEISEIIKDVWHSMNEKPVISLH